MALVKSLTREHIDGSLVRDARKSQMSHNGHLGATELTVDTIARGTDYSDWKTTERVRVEAKQREIERKIKRFKPIADMVLLRLIAPERHLHGLYIPDSAKREAWELWQGEVLAVGPGEIDKKTGARLPMAVKKGDRCMFYSVGGRTATRWPSPEHVILSEQYIQCVLEAE